ncbi:putative transcriptional regulator, TetR family protein [Mycobacterium antarcticum]|uniref:TetR/AcrR family transcriptional regulator n=1 Tax=Mycolicibacterium sp. TUM20983 TaxID=3023369 RepID=UPI002388AE61|nr:TetR/AcrR family transcriptional regulator [Mycolicibacterium sp. TUM20983]GLP76660.1 putative transcriptional regulator, TetR family protein [Mycolicibacterium sp. TUM20983]
MTLASEPPRVRANALPTADRIRQAALASFAAHGTAATTMRGVASAAGVSLGLVQHHFVNKAGLVNDVDDYVLALVVTELGQPMPDLPADSVAEVGDRVTRIFTEHPDVAGYVGRAMVDGSALGAKLFDALMEVGLKRWNFRAERGEIRPDADLTWAAINGLVLGLGAVSLRAHVDRHLPQPLTTPTELQRWRAATDQLLRGGLFRNGDGAVDGD